MYNFWSFFIKNKRFSQLMLGALIIAGVMSLISIPKESTPEVEIPIGVVSTILPGASAEDVEILITDEIEDALTNLANVKRTSSTSAEGFSSVVVEFQASSDIEQSIQKLKDAVDIAKTKLPSEAEDPSVIKVDFSSEPIMILAVTTDRAPTENILLADQVERELEKISGVKDVLAQGLRKREVQVVVRSESLDRFDVSLIDVVSAIQGANVNLPIGSIAFSDINYNVSFDADIKSPEEIGQIIIKESNGIPVYVRDISFVSVGVEKVSNLSRVSVEGMPSEQSLSFSVFKQAGGDITEITSAVRGRLDELQETGVLKGSTVLISYDVGEFVKADLSNLTLTALQTVLLVMIILFFAIGLREALIAGAAIPVSFLIAFIGLSASGNTINFVSLFSLILAVGILVDSAIVIIEGIHAKAEASNGSGASMKEIALDTLKEFHSPLFSGTLTTIAVFTPLFFISGITGEFISSIPFTMIFVLAASVLVALGFLPLIASSILTKKHEESRFEDKRALYIGKIETFYKKVLTSILGNKKREKKIIRWSIGAFFLALLLPVFGIVSVIFFPQENVDFVFIEVEMKGGTVIEQTDLTVRQVEEILYDVPEVESFVTTVGSGSSFSSSGAGDSASSGESIANITVNLKKKRGQSSTEVSNALRNRTNEIKSGDVRVLQTNSGPPGGAPVLIKFFGDDLGVLESVASKGENILKQIKGTRDVETSTKDDGLEFTLSIDRDKASELGVSTPLVAQTLRTAIYGLKATTIKGGGDDIDVVVLLNLNPDYNDPYAVSNTNIDTVRQIEIPTSRGTVLVGSFVDVSLSKGSSAISHEDGKRITTLSSEITDDVTAGEIISLFTSEINKAKIIPENVIMKVGGETEDVNKSFREMGIAFLAGILLMLAILVLQFDSIRYAIFILVIIPLSMIGIFAGLAITRQPLSFPSLMGIIALSGILVNNSIILIDKMNSLRREDFEKSIREVVIEAGVSRLRPILLTTLTTVIGIIPLTYAPGIWAPLAWSIIFGLSFSVLLTLVLVPILYDRWHKG